MAPSAAAVPLPLTDNYLPSGCAIAARLDFERLREKEPARRLYRSWISQNVASGKLKAVIPETEAMHLLDTVETATACDIAGTGTGVGGFALVLLGKFDKELWESIAKRGRAGELNGVPALERDRLWVACPRPGALLIADRRTLLEQIIVGRGVHYDFGDESLLSVRFADKAIRLATSGHAFARRLPELEAVQGLLLQLNADSSEVRVRAFARRPADAQALADRARQVLADVAAQAKRRNAASSTAQMAKQARAFVVGSEMILRVPLLDSAVNELASVMASRAGQ